ncbi:zinc-ribbon domain-containing protein [Paraburkholderia unamae]|uniref:zinc-ribbon domain-containing protein n=1 Tax=Paraburkholderia unamae TaxID=219649 RepID=UPI001CC67D07|nr:zinc-ribbon domain-containing protein [Paraburkholderia unamae]
MKNVGVRCLAESKGEDPLKRLERVAAERGMKLLSTCWQGRNHIYDFACRNGHEFIRSAMVMFRGTATCLECERVESAQRFFDALAQRGLTCAGDFAGANLRYRFTCASGHEWEARASHVLAGTGCPRCMAQSHAKRYLHADGLERLHAAAAARGGRCLATTYDGISAGYTWECANGHRWNVEGAKVVAGSWCGVCAAQQRIAASRLPDGLDRLRGAAEARGGVCLGDTYERLNDRYRFRCAKGHEWKAYGHLVVRGAWCRACSDESLRLGIERMQEVAQARGGRCLSEVYLGSKIKLTWQCHLGHVWEAAPCNVLYRDAWCPSCFRLRITKNPQRRARYGG